ncbi:ATP-grasp domain-containing protein [Variovorax sp. PBL-E5]|uniref:ATP-grasp domain-containing protein n=1 Tax=Variovorax sp. PBL-E5 TaxID=434014 RepID=UPI0013186535|nr:ATP-grasp domain-containing protein [Variovorax sp. PBL-E5]VTU35835.1 Succinyl-CoA ligase [ADP-forming] subunit beta [Variovorax sp. PBL-E5]
MKLLEYEGKALLASHGVPIPPGALWPKQPEAGERGWVVKAQVLAGGRGKRGGILMAATRDELESQAIQLQGKRLGDEPVHAVYVEPMLQIAHEFYLAAFVNRDRGRVTVMASAAGGMDIEQVPPSQVASIDIDPLIGLAGFQIERLKRALGLAQDIGVQFEHIARQVVETLIGEDAELVEINPVIQTADGRLVAADAKVVLDDDAVARHPARSSPIAWSSDSAFMQRCRALGVIGVDNRSRTPPLARPAVALLGNGAGLTMATYDQIAMSGVSVAGAIELHGALARGVAHTAEVIGALFMLEAEIVFINAFYQLRSTDALAQALVQALGMPGAPSRDRVVVRMRGVKQESSQKIMEDAGCFYTPSLSDAADRVLALAAAVAPSQETAR